MGTGRLAQVSTIEYQHQSRTRLPLGPMQFTRVQAKRIRPERAIRGDHSPKRSHYAVPARDAILALLTATGGWVHRDDLLKVLSPPIGLYSEAVLTQHTGYLVKEGLVSREGHSKDRSFVVTERGAEVTGILLTESHEEATMATKTKSSLVVKFKYEKDTKNKVRFKEVVDEDVVPAIETLYLMKSEYEKLGSPKTLTVTVSA